MSATLNSSIVKPDSTTASNVALGLVEPTRGADQKNYHGFIAGIFSGIAKLSGTFSGSERAAEFS